MAAVRDFMPSPGAPETGETMAVTGPFATRGGGAAAVAAGGLAAALGAAPGAGGGSEATGGGAARPPDKVAAISGAILAARLRIAALSTPLHGSAPERPGTSCSPETRPTRPPLESLMSRI